MFKPLKTTIHALTAGALFLGLMNPHLGHASNFLSPGKAFPVAVKLSHGTLRVRFSIAPGYALYRKRMAIRLADMKNIKLGKALWPTPIAVQSPFAGKELMYRGKVSIRIPFVCSAGQSHQVKLHIRFQGCADAGLCYPPVDKKIRLSVATQSC